MKFEYVGYRPIISQLGISFKQGKDDKYIYLPYVYELFHVVNSSYETNKNHSNSIKIENSNIEKLYKEILAINQNLDSEIETKLDLYKKHIKAKYEELENRDHMNEIDKNIYLSNLKFMENYRINRAKNKIFYYISIYTIASIIRGKKIKKLEIPFNEKFWHTLKTLQGVLSSEKVSNNLSTFEKNGQIYLLFTTNL